ncbi:MAG: RNA polymerase sigma factor [Actinobacteria bacterium]|nr:RNA polymerase sigma factor [Actinomycetota bacterium]
MADTLPPMTSIEPGAEGDDRLRFEACFRDHYADILAFAIRRQRDRQSAEDAASETFAVAWRRRGLIPERPLPWLYAIALRVLANQRRSGLRRRRLEERLAQERAMPADVSDPTDALARRSAFAAVFARLGEDDREVLRLIAWEGLEPREAAVVLGCSYGAFRVRLHRARRRLGKQLAAAGHSTSDVRRTDVRAIKETR